MKLVLLSRICVAASSAIAFGECLRLLVILPDAVLFLLKNVVLSPATFVSLQIMPIESLILVEMPAAFIIAFAGSKRVSFEGNLLLFLCLIVMACAIQLAVDIASGFLVPIGPPAEASSARLIANAIQVTCLWGVAIKYLWVESGSRNVK